MNYEYSVPTYKLCVKYRVIRNDCRGFNKLSSPTIWDRSICIFLFNRTTLQLSVTYITGALYVHPLWFYKHQHDNRVRSKLFVACQRWWFQWRFWFVLSVRGYLREEEENKSDPWRNPIERNHMGLHVSTQNAFSLPFAAILVNCAPSGEMHNYCTPHIIKENWEFLDPSVQLYTPISSVLCMTNC